MVATSVISENEDKPEEAKAIIVIYGPTARMVIPTAASSILSPKSWTIPAYMALLAQDIVPIIANALRPRKLLLRTLPTNKPRATATITLVKIIVPPRLIAAPVDRNEMEPPITKRNAPTSAPDPCANGVVKPPIFSHEGKRKLIHAPINMGIIMFPPGIENFFFAFLVELMKTCPFFNHPSRCPPSQSPISPVIKLAASQPKKRIICAISTGSAARPSGIMPMTLAFLSGSSTSEVVIEV